MKQESGFLFHTQITIYNINFTALGGGVTGTPYSSEAKGSTKGMALFLLLQHLAMFPVVGIVMILRYGLMLI